MALETPRGAPSVPSVSVIIPAYNAEATIGRQLEALSRQRIATDWEVIVCDNGSSDGTAAAARRWSDRLPVRVIDASSRRGPSAARNAGAAAARAPLFAFCDADDAVADEWLPRLLPVLEQHPVVVTCSRTESPFSTRERPIYDLVTTLRMPFLPELPYGSSAHLAVSAEAFRRVGGFEESLRTAEDVDLCWRLQLAGYRLVECREAVVDRSRRSGFFATVRQYMGYQLGRRQLRHRYARIIAEFDAARGDRPPTDGDGALGRVDMEGAIAADVPSTRLGRLRRLLRDPHELGQFLQRTLRSSRIRSAEALGLRLGRRFGRVDAAQPQLPASLARTYLSREQSAI